MAEREQRGGLFFVSPAVSHENILIVIFRNRVAPLFRGRKSICVAGIFPTGMRSHVFKFNGESKRKFPRRIHITCKHIGYGIPGLRTYEPALHHSGHTLNPRHSNRIARNIDHNKVLVNLGKLLYQTVLAIRQTEPFTVGILAVLMRSLVQTSYKNHIIGIFRRSHGFGKHFLSTAVIGNILHFHAVLLCNRIPHITTRINNLHTIACSMLQPLKRRNLPTGFQRRTSATYGHHLYGILTNNSDFLLPVEFQRQQIPLIFQKHNPFAGNLPRSSQMLR